MRVSRWEEDSDLMRETTVLSGLGGEGKEFMSWVGDEAGACGVVGCEGEEGEERTNMVVMKDVMLAVAAVSSVVDTSSSCDFPASDYMLRRIVYTVVSVCLVSFFG